MPISRSPFLGLTGPTSGICVQERQDEAIAIGMDANSSQMRFCKQANSDVVRLYREVCGLYYVFGYYYKLSPPYKLGESNLVLVKNDESLRNHESLKKGNTPFLNNSC